MPADQSARLRAFVLYGQALKTAFAAGMAWDPVAWYRAVRRGLALRR
jgi:hypothetical protein